MRSNRTLIVFGAALLVLALLAGGFLTYSARAQGSQPPGREAVDAPDAVSNYIPVQGRLTDDAGTPLDGDYSLTFRLYDDNSDEAIALCSYTITTAVDNGLFSTYMNASTCADKIDGRQLYLGIQVGSDAEMTPRAYIDNVPYAWSLRPGAQIEANLDEALLTVYNTGGLGEAIWASSLGGPGIYGASLIAPGVHGNSWGGAGVYGESLGGAAIAAGGTGIITSTAETSLWISGNGVRPFDSTDTTQISMDTIGGALVRSGSAGDKYVMLPVTLPGVLYGQNVTITAIDIYFLAQGEFEGITDIRVRRQNNVVCATCYLDILHDPDFHGCDRNVTPTGCSLHYELTDNNELSASSGVIHIGLGLTFGGTSSYVEIGGVKLTLAHDK